MADEEDKGEAELLQISTVLPSSGGKPAFLLARVQGTEGISMPYSYEVTLLRPNTLPDFEPRQLIGTACSFGINMRDDDDPQGAELVNRKGVFEHLERVSSDVLGFRLYYGRIVPAFKLMGNEVRFRVFENLNPVQIIEQSLSEFSHMVVNTSLLKQSDFPRLEYSVQFGETTFGFVSRLMARFGMWYMFNHDSSPVAETLVISHDNMRPISNAKFSVVDLLDVRPQRTVAVYNFVRKYQPASTTVNAGGFNPLQPIDPFLGSSNQLPLFDVQDGGTGQRFTRSSFADPVLSRQEATDFAKAKLQSEEAAVYQVTGDSNNASFLAGRTFIIAADKTNDTPQDEDVPTKRMFEDEAPKYLITYMSLLATVGHHGHNAITTLIDLWKDMTKTVGTGEVEDVTASITNGMLSNYFQNQQQTAWTNVYYGGADQVKFLPSLMTGITASLVGLIPTIIGSAKNVAQAHGSQYGNSFIAIPFRPQKNIALPPPVAAPRPIAHGPHLAVVIGDDGAKPTGGVDVHADALGRVRVRFPWDPGPPQPSAFGPFETGKNTCWVRVSEGWAGASYGTQFLPRIGQQVLVSFIDGDPEQPIITGRVYAASRGPTDLPFPAQSVQGKNLKIDDWKNPTASSALPRSGIKTRSTPAPDGPGAGFHMIRMDDNKGKEQFLIRSQGRTDVTSMHSYFETTKGNRNVQVQGGKNDDGSAAGGGLFVTTTGEYDLHIGEKRYEKVDRHYQLSVSGRTIFDLMGLVQTYSHNDWLLSADSIVMKASKKISLQVGKSDIVITPMAVYVDGAIIKHNAPGSPGTITDQEVEDAENAPGADPGEPPNFLELQPKGGGGGGRGHHTAEAATAIVVTAVEGGWLRVGDPNKSKLFVDAKDLNFAEGAVADIAKLGKTEDGAGVLQLINTSPNPVVIKKPDQATNPPTSGTQPDDAAGATQKGEPTGQTDAQGNPILGTGTGSPTTVLYDPKASPPNVKNAPPGTPTSDQILQQRLREANADTHGTNPANTFGGTPNKE
jgi:uncharacterized protein involved in type VI secretion and phage assembly